MGKKYHRAYQKNNEKSSKKTPENSPNRQKSCKLAPEGACRSKFASQTPKSAKMARKWCPRGDPLDPQRDPKIAKIIKKSNQKFIIFPNPVRDRILTILDPKIKPKWVQNEVSESTTRGKIQKRKNLKFAILSTKNTYFSRSENMQN